MKTIMCCVLLCCCSIANAASPKPEERRFADLALGKYKLNVQAAQQAYEKALEAAQDDLTKNYDKAIASAMKRGSVGLELANQLLAERKAKLEESPEGASRAMEDGLFAPDRQKIVRMMTTGPWFGFWTKSNRDDPMTFTVTPDGSLLGREQSGREGTWVVERRWVLHQSEHVLIPIDESRLRGFHIPSDTPFNVFRNPQ